MNHPPELVMLIQQERERAIAAGRLARTASCVNSCCSTSMVDRLARALRLAPASC